MLQFANPSASGALCAVLLFAAGTLGAPAVQAQGFGFGPPFDPFARHNWEPPQDAQAEDLARTLEVILSDDERDPEQRIEEALEVIRSRPAAERERDNAAQRPDPRHPFARQGGWDPFAEMERMRAWSDQFFHQPLTRMRPFGNLGPGAFSDINAWAPEGEFAERDDAYIYRFDLPGVEEGKFTVTARDGMLVLEGRRETHAEEAKSDERTGEQRTIRREVRAGTFQRVLSLPPDADSGAMTTEMKDGVLTVTIPRREAQQQANANGNPADRENGARERVIERIR